jgi:Thiol-activated cytolysin
VKTRILIMSLVTALPLALAIGTSPTHAQIGDRFKKFPAPAPTATPAVKINKEVQSNPFPALQPFRDRWALLEAPTVEAFIEAIPTLKRLRDRADRMVGGESTSQESIPEGGRSRNVNVSQQRYSLQTTPEEITTFDPVAGFWLGAILEEKGLRLGLGSQREVPIPATSRAPFRVTTNLPIAEPSRLVEAPSASTVQAAINSMISSANSKATGGGMHLKFSENHSAEQVARDFGLDAAYMGARVKAGLTVNKSIKRQSVALMLTEKAFTMSMDAEGRSRRPAFFNDNFTLDQAKALVNQGRLGVDLDGGSNVPTYLKSITYGRIVLINITSDMSAEELKTKLAGSFQSGAANINTNFNSALANSNNTFELRVTTFGGPRPSEGGFKLIPVSGGANLLQTLNEYLNQPTPLSTMVPISYTAYTLKDDNLAAMQRTSEYTVTKYAAESIGTKYTFRVAFVGNGDDGAADNTNEIYGDVQLNGRTIWSRSRDQARSNARQQGQDLDLGSSDRGDEFVVEQFHGDPVPTVRAKFWDWDEGSQDDLMYDYTFPVDFDLLSTFPSKTVPVNNYQRSQNATSVLEFTIVRSEEM